MADESHPEGHVYTYSTTELGVSTMQFQLHPEVLPPLPDVKYACTRTAIRELTDGGDVSSVVARAMCRVW